MLLKTEVTENLRNDITSALNVATTCLREELKVSFNLFEAQQTALKAQADQMAARQLEAADSASRQETFLQGEHVKAQGMLQDPQDLVLSAILPYGS